VDAIGIELFGILAPPHLSSLSSAACNASAAVDVSAAAGHCMDLNQQLCAVLVRLLYRGSVVSTIGRNSDNHRSLARWLSVGRSS